MSERHAYCVRFVRRWLPDGTPSWCAFHGLEMAITGHPEFLFPGQSVWWWRVKPSWANISVVDTEEVGECLLITTRRTGDQVEDLSSTPRCAGLHVTRWLPLRHERSAIVRRSSNRKAGNNLSRYVSFNPRRKFIGALSTFLGEAETIRLFRQHRLVGFADFLQQKTRILIPLDQLLVSNAQTGWLPPGFPISLRPCAYPCPTVHGWDLRRLPKPLWDARLPTGPWTLWRPEVHATPKVWASINELRRG